MQHAKQVGMNYSAKSFTNCQRSMQASMMVQNSQHAKTQEECSHPLAISSPGAHEKDWGLGVSLGGSLEEGSGKEAFILCRTSIKPRVGGGGTKP